MKASVTHNYLILMKIRKSPEYEPVLKRNFYWMATYFIIFFIMLSNRHDTL